MSDFRPVQGEFTGRHMLLIMIAFFGVIIGVNVLMATVASRSWTGLVVKNSYVASQNFNAELEAARQQAGLGWNSHLAIDGRSVSVQLSDSDGPLAAMAVEVKLARPTNEASDRLLTLVEREPGRYEAPAALDAGAWHAELSVRSPAGEHMRLQHRIVVPVRAGS